MCLHGRNISAAATAAMPRAADRPAGFTLVEILIVVVILGIIAAIVIPEITVGQEDTSAATFAANLRIAFEGVRLYRQKHFTYPADYGPGIVPKELVAYTKGLKWDKPTPIGGKWDWDYKQFGYTAGVSVYLPDRSDEEMTRVDAILDDGDLITGAFRKRNNGYIYVIEY